VTRGADVRKSPKGTEFISPARECGVDGWVGIAENLGLKVLAAGGTSNHFHLLIGLPTSLTLAEVVQKLKANSSRWFEENGVQFEWQKGYGAFSVSPSLLTTVQAYIRNQEEHHHERSFEE
jgi:putative transposase